MTGNEITDSGLSPAQETELAALLHAAADRLDVVTPPADDVAARLADAGRRADSRRADGPRPASARTGRARWTVGAVAAAAVLLAGGAWFVTGAQDAQQVATGGPDGSGEGAAGTIWQWPGTLPDGLEVTGAITSSTWFGFQLAVDDPASPSRWLAIVPAGYGFASGTDVPAATGTLANGATYSIYAPRADSQTGATWAAVTGPGNTGYLTVAALGVDHQSIIDLLADVVDRAPNLTDVADVDNALRTLTLPDGLVPAWDPDRVGFADQDSTTARTLSLVLSTPEGGEQIALSMEQLDVAPAVAALDTLLQLDANRLAVDGAPTQTVSRRDDLAPGTLVIEEDGTTSVFVTTADGTRVAVVEVAGSTTPIGLPSAIDVVRGLRVLSESEVRARLDELGVDLEDASDGIRARRDAADGATSPSTTATVGPTTTVDPTTIQSSTGG